MLRIAGQTAGPYRLKFLWTLMGGGGVIGKNKFDIFSKNFFQTLFFQFWTLQLLKTILLITY